MSPKRAHSMVCILFSITLLAACATPTPTLTVTPIPPIATTMPISPTTTPRQTPTPVPENVEGMINPGDEIDGMVFETDDAWDFDISIFAYCGFEQDKVTDTTSYDECLAWAGGRIFFGHCQGVQGDTTVELDDSWPKLKSEMTFDGKEINLPAFGSLDFMGDDTKYRVWNVLVENLAQGKHTIRCKSDYGGQSFTSTWVFKVVGPQTYSTLFPTVSPGQHKYTSMSAGLNFLLYLPDEYGKDPQQEWPLILYLHGADEKGYDLEVLKRQPLPETLEKQTDFPFVVVAPQLAPNLNDWSEVIDSLNTLLDEIQEAVTVDDRRVYLTGPSMGGAGTWQFALQYPQRFAALVPVAGYYLDEGWTVPGNLCDLRAIPVWEFHGAKDESVSLYGAEILVNAFKVCGGNIQFTVYPDADHEETWRRAYADPELYTWLLDQTLR